MNEEEKKILLKIQEQVEENADILKGIRSKNRREAFGKIIYYLILIGISIYTWAQIKPFYDKFFGVTEKIENLGGRVDKVMNGLDKLENVSNLLK